MITVPETQTSNNNELIPLHIHTHLFQQIYPIANILATQSNQAWIELAEKLQKIQIESNKPDTQTNVGRKSGEANSLNKRVKSRENSGIKLSQDQSETTIKNKLSKIRTVSQNHNFRSSKKVQEIPHQKEEEEKKAERLQLITKRKIELMEKLKRIDAELIDARRHPSPVVDKSFENRSFINKNQSFLSNSRNKFVGDNLENHSKAVEMIQKLNIEKMRRQEKMAEEMHKKQQIELLKIQELEKKRKEQLEERRKRTQIPTVKPNRNYRLQSIKTKMNEFSEQSETSVMPSTIVPRLNGQKIDLDSNEFLENVDKKRPSYVLTENNFDNEEEVQSHEIIKDDSEEKEDKTEEKQKEDKISEKQQEERQMYDNFNKSFVKENHEEQFNAHQSLQNDGSESNEENKADNGKINQNGEKYGSSNEKNSAEENEEVLAESNQGLEESGLRISGSKGEENIGVEIKY